MNSIVREMEASDIDEVMEIENESFAVPWSREAFESEVGRNPLAAYIVAEVDGTVAGYGGMWFILDEAHITNVAARKIFRGKGIGSRLVEGLLERAAEKGICNITLEVREGNLPAIGLYEKFGFVVEGRRPKYYQDNKEDALIMWRRRTTVEL